MVSPSRSRPRIHQQLEALGGYRKVKGTRDIKLFPYYQVRQPFFKIAAPFNKWSVGDFFQALEDQRGPEEGRQLPAERLWAVELTARLWWATIEGNLDAVEAAEKLLRQFRIRADSGEKYTVVNTWAIRIDLPGKLRI